MFYPRVRPRGFVLMKFITVPPYCNNEVEYTGPFMVKIMTVKYGDKVDDMPAKKLTVTSEWAMKRHMLGYKVFAKNLRELIRADQSWIFYVGYKYVIYSPSEKGISPCSDIQLKSLYSKIGSNEVQDVLKVKANLCEALKEVGHAASITLRHQKEVVEEEERAEATIMVVGGIHTRNLNIILPILKEGEEVMTTTFQLIPSQRRQTNQKLNAINAIEKEEEISLLLAYQVKEETHRNLSYLDTGCNNHMCGNKSAFSTLDELYQDSIKFGDNSKVSVMGKGQVIIQTKRDAAQTISNVLYVLDLKTNLLILGQLQEKRRPAWLSNYEVAKIDQSEYRLTHFALFSNCDPTNFESAIKDVKWQKAMDDEIAAIERNDTWELIVLPEGHKMIGVKWVYKTKLKGMGKLTSTRHG
ncbi:hypothetical protein GH714_023138 [Hevea brasiliensis]|uniref:Retrovirus-related Pol polyprotein from transposon TNT 1-94-like beta-barrel domain-containing protein n=1 Tax=Hevea brasiliensis TaxID=3981 RepID=A0A6A6KYE2_HEVBR|nr:hypothetical protein GH714_023138 [Hevea brasiliensis]